MYIKHKFTSLNQYINAERSNRFLGAKIKREETDIAYYSLINEKPIKTPCKLRFTWYVKNKRMDIDNIAFSKKFILDSMVKAKIIPNDNLNHIIGLVDEVEIREEEGVKIEVIK